MNQVNRIAFSRREFRDIEDLHKAVSQQVLMLLDAGYTIVASKEDELGDTVVIDYSYVKDQDDWPKPFWLQKNEMVAAADIHIDNEVTNARQIIDTAEKADKIVNDFFDTFKKPGGSGDGGNFDA